MTNTVAHAFASRPSKSNRIVKKKSGKAPETAPASEKRARAPIAAEASEAKEYGMACLKEARERLAQMSVAALIEDADLDTDAFRELAQGMSTNFAGIEATIEAIDSPVRRLAAPRVMPEMALTSIGSVVPLRKAVDQVIGDVDGIVRECRAAIDRAAAMHIYIVGRALANAGDERFYAPSDDPDGDFSESLAEAVGALKCLLTYVDQLRPESLSLKRMDRASQAIERDRDEAAE